VRGVGEARDLRGGHEERRPIDLSEAEQRDLVAFLGALSALPPESLASR